MSGVSASTLRIAPVIAVEKGPHPILDDPRVEWSRVFELEGHTIGMMHDFEIGRAHV